MSYNYTLDKLQTNPYVGSWKKETREICRSKPYTMKSTATSDNKKECKGDNHHKTHKELLNRAVIETVDKILQESDSAPIIIIQGDHGTPTQLGGGGLRWDNINDDSIRERTSIFSAYYLPNLDAEVIYEGITPVNSFRIVLNNYLNGDYELLEDKIYFSTYQDMLNFTDVTNLTLKPDLNK